MKLSKLIAMRESTADALLGRGSLYDDYDVGWNNGISVNRGGKKLWSCSAEESKKFKGKIKFGDDTSLIRYLASTGIL